MRLLAPASLNSSHFSKPFAAIVVMLIIVAVLVLSAVPALAGNPQLGQSVQHNIRAMTVDLNPVYANAMMEGTSGTLAEGVITRYQLGRVKSPRSLPGDSSVGGADSGASDAKGNASGAAAPRSAPR